MNETQEIISESMKNHLSVKLIIILVPAGTREREEREPEVKSMRRVKSRLLLAPFN